MDRLRRFVMTNGVYVDATLVGYDSSIHRHAEGILAMQARRYPTGELITIIVNNVLWIEELPQPE